ncbi:MAG: hypothetical protein ACD_63C00210G0003 [uncultured bacterium]|nr:MAG: hypothetical protein ACD_63C00210G0003 [uncultured bacterium]
MEENIQKRNTVVKKETRIGNSKYLYGNFNKKNVRDEVLIPVGPGQSPKIKSRVNYRYGKWKIWLVPLIAVAIAGLAYYMYMKNDFVNIGKNIEQKNSSDMDLDGLADDMEKKLGTDPNNKDTDGDGYQDGMEVEAGYDPKEPAKKF